MINILNKMKNNLFFTVCQTKNIWEKKFYFFLDGIQESDIPTAEPHYQLQFHLSAVGSNSKLSKLKLFAKYIPSMWNIFVKKKKRDRHCNLAKRQRAPHSVNKKALPVGLLGRHGNTKFVSLFFLCSDKGSTRVGVLHVLRYMWYFIVSRLDVAQGQFLCEV